MNPASAAGSVAIYKPPITVNDPGDILPCGHPAQCARSVNVITGATGRDVFTYHGCQWCDDMAACGEMRGHLVEVARRAASSSGIGDETATEIADRVAREYLAERGLR